MGKKFEDMTTEEIQDEITEISGLRDDLHGRSLKLHTELDRRFAVAQARRIHKQIGDTGVKELLRLTQTVEPDPVAGEAK